MPETATLGLPALFQETSRTLQQQPRELPAVWLYDALGSRLFEAITRLPAYYLTRREASILGRRSREIAERTRAKTLIELGAGTAPNTRFLLAALDDVGTLERFVPVDVSVEALRTSARTIAAMYPHVAVQPVVGDFEHDLDVPCDGRRLVAFLGSTIGNLPPQRRSRLLRTLARTLADDDALLIGFDLVKGAARLVAAYADDEGVTEAFVRNALTAVNRKLGATFDQRLFAYEARWEPEREWMDIGLRAQKAHAVVIPTLELEIGFADGEWLRVEISAKFRRDRIEREIGAAGLQLEAGWTDPAGDFALALIALRQQRGTE